MLKQSQQQYSFILPTWKNHEKSIKILQISSKKLESEKGMSWTIGSPNGGATGGGPGIGCIGWKGLAEAQFTILPIFGERKIVSSTRCFWDFWKFLLFFSEYSFWSCFISVVLRSSFFSLVLSHWFFELVGTILGSRTAAHWEARHRLGDLGSESLICAFHGKNPSSWRGGLAENGSGSSSVSSRQSCPVHCWTSYPLPCVSFETPARHGSYVLGSSK